MAAISQERKQEIIAKFRIQRYRELIKALGLRR